MVAAFAIVFVFWDMKPVFYALWSPFTFLMGYSDPRRPTDDKLAGTRPQIACPAPCRAASGGSPPLTPLVPDLQPCTVLAAS